MLLKSKKESEKAVSPVIGVILIVAITVILGAVVGTAALGFGEQVEQNARAGANIDFTTNGPSNSSTSGAGATSGNPSNQFTVSWISGGNADYLNVSLSGALKYDESQDEGPARLNRPGASVTFSPPGDANGAKGTSGAQYYDGGSIEDFTDGGDPFGPATFIERTSGGLSDSDGGTELEGEEVTVTIVAVTEGGSETTVLTKEYEF
jgi:flagellin-like protein